jgi:MFS superfamily sulfate permease-like transporter
VVASSSPEDLGAVGLLTLLAGLLLAAAALLRLGFLADLISAPVLTGFLSGVGVSLMIGKLPGMLGIEASGTTWQKLVDVVAGLGSVHWPSALLAAATVVIMLGSGRIHSRVPAALLALVVVSTASVLLDAAARGVPMVGAIPAGLPALGLPPVSWPMVGALLPTAAAIAVVVLAQSSAVARSFGAKNNYAVDANRDLFALGAANALSSVSGAFVVNGSPPRTSAGDEAGSRSQVVNVAMAGVIAIVLLFATGLFADIPAPVLDAVVFAIGIHLIKVAELRRIARCRRSEFVTAMLALVVVAFVGVKEGVLLAVLVSLADRLRRQYRPGDEVLAEPGSIHPRLARRLDPGRPSPQDVLVFRYGTSLFFENAANFTDRVHELLRDAAGPVRVVVLDLAAMSDLDYTGVQTLVRLAEDLQRRDCSLVLTEPAAKVAVLLERAPGAAALVVVPRLEDAVVGTATNG